MNVCAESFNQSFSVIIREHVKKLALLAGNFAKASTPPPSLPVSGTVAIFYNLKNFFFLYKCL